MLEGNDAVRLVVSGLNPAGDGDDGIVMRPADNERIEFVYVTLGGERSRWRVVHEAVLRSHVTVTVDE